MDFSGYLMDAGGYYHTSNLTDFRNSKMAEILFGMPFDFIASLVNSSNFASHISQFVIEGASYWKNDLTPRMGAITLPFLALWGACDMVIPPVWPMTPLTR